MLGEIGLGLSGLAALYGAMEGGQSGHRRLSQQMGYEQLAHFRDPLGNLMRSAKKHGIHPLYALGNAPSVSMPSVDFYPDSRSSKADAIGRIASAVSQYGSQKERSKQRALDRAVDADLRTKEAQARKSEAEAISAEAAAALARQPAVTQWAPPELQMDPAVKATSGGTWPDEGPTEGKDVEELIGQGIEMTYRDRWVKPKEKRMLMEMYCKKHPMRCRKGKQLKYKKSLKGLTPGVHY